MRATQSSNASGMYSSSGAVTIPLPVLAAETTMAQFETGQMQRLVSPCSVASPSATPQESDTLLAVAEGEGLVHDAQNLLGALGLYCDLLSIPGVLRPEHRHYADELRLLGNRSGNLIRRLLPSLPVVEPQRKDQRQVAAPVSRAAADVVPVSLAPVSPAPVSLAPVSLREIIRNCQGLLRGAAGGRDVEIEFGPSSSMPVAVGVEAVERIVVNLVRNSAAAMERSAEKSSVGGTIRIGVGVGRGRGAEGRAYPFGRVGLTVEDTGCGMEAMELERMLRANQPGRSGGVGGRGIGFRVVRELVAASDGHLAVTSVAGVGTRVRIDWPVATRAMEAGSRTVVRIRGREEARSVPRADLAKIVSDGQADLGDETGSYRMESRRIYDVQGVSC